MLVSVIVPAYKQQKTIKDDIRRIYNVMTKTRWDFEIIVVVDGFQDDTYKNAKELNLAEVTVVGYPTNRGKGYAVRYGMARAVGDYIAFIDSGMDIDPNGISMILEHMEWYEADIIVGSKGHPASKVVYPWWRKIYSKGYYTVVRLLFGVKVRDTQTGLKVYKREVLEKVLPRLVVKKFAFDIELLSVANRLGFKRIFEAPVVINMDYRKSTFTALLFLDKEIQRILYDTISIFYRMYFLRYYDDKSKRKWVYDKELDLYVNTGEVEKV